MTSTVPEQDGGERRVAPRTRVLKRAKVIFNNGYSTYDCIVRNISATGALLTLDDSVHLPKEFRIKIGEEQNTRLARLVYRRTMFAGIRFIDLTEEPMSAAEAAARQGDSAGEGASTPQALRPGIRRIQPETLPVAVTARFAWNRRS
ncbi:PilZ domain-containing protein [Jiella marina]|uniref:PilZ domain-containing protein n=1 Tax=Jiella sp. LLJ827 TaxID=2917712 RepID=UPI002100C12A|nr:PilZ domain-containing protein [Jiella sp. LLJ827]MCQ0990414.1 PilZ domain-containing protein [Jiella sp. LLJ827]